MQLWITCPFSPVQVASEPNMAAYEPVSVTDDLGFLVPTLIFVLF